MSQCKRTNFEKSQDIIGRDVGIGIYNMESWDKKILNVKLVQNQNQSHDNVEGNQDNIDHIKTD